MRRAVIVVLATLLPAMTWLVAVPLLGIDLDVPVGDGSKVRAIGLPAVIASSLLGSLVGWAGLALLEWMTRWASAVWTATALAIVAVSFVPLLDPEMPTATVVVFTIMRLLIAAVLIPGLVLSRRDVADWRPFGHT